MTQIATSTTAYALGDGYAGGPGWMSGRKVDRCQDGTIWMVMNSDNASPITNKFYYSKDNGASWTDSGAGLSGATGGSIFIDLDDNLHYVFTQIGNVRGRTNGNLYYLRATPNAGRTSWTWTTTDTLIGNQSLTYCGNPDVVAHRNGTGWKAHWVFAFNSSVGGALYGRADITSGGVITVDVDTSNGNQTGNGVTSATAAGNGISFPSIDFHHTGDGKTVQGGTPHLYIAWVGNQQGGYGVRCRKITATSTSAFSAITTNAEVVLDSTRWIGTSGGGGGGFQWFQGFFDGTRFNVVGMLNDLSANLSVMLYQRNMPTDTTTTTTTLWSPTTANTVYAGSATYDASGNVYVVGRTSAAGTGLNNLISRRWVRSGGTLDAVNTILSGSSPDDPWCSFRRGSQNGQVDVLYRSGTASPYPVNYASPNHPPTVSGVGPTGTLTNAKPTLTATVSDPDSDPSYAYFQVATDAGFTNIVFQGQGSTVTSGGTSILVATGLDASTLYYVKAYASDGSLSSAYSSAVTFTTSAALTQTFTYTGSDQTFVVPTGVTLLGISSHGAGGASAGGGGVGGAGGLAASSVTTTPAESLTIRVGGAGVSAGAYPGGGLSNTIGCGGGGYSGVFRSTTPLNIAGGGGGGGGYTGSGWLAAGGAGGGTTGTAGASIPSQNATGGGGGTPSAGGAAGPGQNTNGQAGSSLQGGAGANNQSSPARTGGGGGGYYGGGGGGYGVNQAGGGGGGGSSYTTGSNQSTTGGGGAAADTNGIVVVSYPNYTTTTNNAPNAPALTAPAAAAVVPAGATTLSWTFSDPDSGASQGGYVLRLIDPTGATVYWNATTQALQGGVVINASASASAILPAGVLYGGPWQFSVSTTDEFGLQGAFAANRAFTVAGGFSMMI